ncbi:MAG: helix-turn-helix domain-containing protein [Acidobacteria bacterium]|nr:MAG: helix-turn-helix domain-containing protein [Acidobacteriota bacterium]
MWEVAHLVGVAPLSVSRWRQALEREGMEGLCARRHPGKPLKPTSRQKQALAGIR